MSGAPIVEIDESLLAGFLDESIEALDGVDRALVELEKNPRHMELIHEIFRAVHSIKGNAPFFGLTNVRVLAHDLECLLSMLRDGSRPATEEMISVLLAGADELRALFGRVQLGTSDSVDEVAFGALRARIRSLREQSAEASDSNLRKAVSNLKPFLENGDAALGAAITAVLAALGDAESGPGEPAADRDTPREEGPVSSGDSAREPQSVRHEQHKSMRVAEEHVDSFLAYIGELFIFGETLTYLTRRLTGIEGRTELNFELGRQVEAFKVLTQNLQRSVMSIRRVPVGGLVNKVPRLVRDVATKLGKEIDVNVRGHDVEVDKSLIELMDAPLTHMVRNAADHGVEDPAERERAGKSRAGTIDVTIREEEKFVVMEVSDDGAGLNLEALRKKAQSIGLIRAGEALSEGQIIDLIFAPGISTAEQVTEISGRGVGMEVVKRAIEDSGGRIAVSTERGRGSKFRIELVKSVTTNILEGIIFRAGDQYFILPADRVLEVFSSRSGCTVQEVGGAKVIERHGELVPILPAYEKLSSRGGPGEGRGTQIITVKSNHRHVGLMVDEVMSIQQVVLKELNCPLLRNGVFLGAALIGDGQIALLIDTDLFCRTLGVNASGVCSDRTSSRAGAGAPVDPNAVKRALLLVRAKGRSLGIPLEEVQRLEYFSNSAVEHAGDDLAIQYNGGIMPLSSLSGTLEMRQDATLKVVVSHRAGRVEGFVVDEIVDIIEEHVSIHRISSRPSRRSLGNAVIRGAVTEIVSLSSDRSAAEYTAL